MKAKFRGNNLEYLLIVIAIVTGCINTNAQSWVSVGSQGFSAGQANNTSIAINGNGVPYVAYADGNTLDGGTNGYATVMKYNGSSWIAVGSPQFSGGTVQYTSLAIDNSGTPYVAYVCNYGGYGAPGVNVLKYNGGTWETLTCDTCINGQYTSIAIDTGGTPYVVYVDGNNKATVIKYNGSSWGNVGNAEFAENVTYTSIIIDVSGTPYVAFADSNYKATVMKYNGSSWVSVGNREFSIEVLNAGYPCISLAIDTDGTPYVVYSGGSAYAATVMKYNGSSWVTVGSAGFSAGATYYPSIAVDKRGTPYVVYLDEIPDAVTVMKFNGTSWVTVGSAGFSAGDAYFESIAIDTSGTPYVAYQDLANGNKATVMKFDSTTGVKNMTDPSPVSLAICPNPNNGAFTLLVASAIEESIIVTITNVLGEKVEEFTIGTNKANNVKLEQPPGMYIITCVTSHDKHFEKIMIYQ